MSPTNALDLVEAAYQSSGRDEQWLSAVIDLSQTAMDRGYGLVGHLYNYSRSDARQTTEAFIGPRGTDLMPLWHSIFQALPDYMVARITRYLCTSPPLFTARQAMQRMLTRHRLADEASSPLLTAPQAMQLEYRDVEKLLDSQYGRLGLADSLTLNAHATAGEGLMIHIPSRERVSLDPATRRRWSMILAHLASALRLRRTLHAAASAGSVADPVEAVLSPDGRLQHAFGPAKTRQGRAALRGSVTHLDRVRAQATRSGGDQADEALSLWTGLVDGRWSIIDRFDSDGRRYLVAYRNDCSIPDPRALNAREAQVCRLLTYGHANKHIAYELGLSISTVATHIASARRKLRARSRVELIRILQAALIAAD